MLCNASQPENADFPILVTLLKSISFNFLQPLNVDTLISVTFPKLTLPNASQLANIPFPIVVTLLKTISFNFLQPLNADPPIVLTLSPKTTSHFVFVLLIYLLNL